MKIPYSSFSPLKHALFIMNLYLEAINVLLNRLDLFLLLLLKLSLYTSCKKKCCARFNRKVGYIPVPAKTTNHPFQTTLLEKLK